MRSKIIKQIKPIDFQWETADPFLFCAYHHDAFPRGNSESGPDASLAGRNIGMDFTLRDGWRMYHGDKVPGFPVHPHRGFETVTVVQRGMVDHADSMGAAGRYGEGDTQWMTAGRGVQHSEMFPLIDRSGPNELELFQIWLNLPAKSKMIDPHFSMFWSEKIPKKIYQSDHGASTSIDIIAGELDGMRALDPPPGSWASDAQNHVTILTIVMEAGAEWQLPATVAGLNRTLYFYRGSSCSIDGEHIGRMHLATLSSDEEVSVVAGDEECRLLLLQGRPIGEPVAQHGPFVMNTREELMQAFEDYQKDQFGGWSWSRNDPVHIDRGRFAKHADGYIEEPS